MSDTKIELDQNELIKQSFFTISNIVLIILSFAASIITLLSFFSKNMPIIITSIIIFILILAVVIKKIVDEYEVKLANIAESLHTFNHLLRDNYFKLRKLYNEKKLTNETIASNLNSTLLQAINLLSSTLNKLTGKKICVCVKIFDLPNKKKEIGEYVLITLCRCSNSLPGRYQIQNTKVKDDTDFFELLNNGEPHFFNNNLIKYAKNKLKCGYSYKNSNPTWQNFYKSTIVVPIRISIDNLYGKQISNSKKDSNKYFVLGFLCVDSDSVNAFKNVNLSLNLVKSFADALFKYLEKSRFYLEKTNQI